MSTIPTFTPVGQYLSTEGGKLSKPKQKQYVPWRLAKMGEQFGQIEQALMGGYGRQGRMDIERSGQIDRSRMLNDLVGRGLANSTVYDSLYQSSIEGQQRQLAQLNENIGAMRMGNYQQLFQMMNQWLQGHEQRKGEKSEGSEIAQIAGTGLGAFAKVFAGGF